MKGVRAGVQYDRKTIRLHWLTATLVILLWCLGQTIDWFPRGAPRVFARSAHITIGAMLAAILMYRIWWRRTGGLHFPMEKQLRWQQTARTMHVILYVCVLATIALGIANAWVRGDNLFNLFKIPAFDPGNKDLRRLVENYHAYAANLVLVLVGCHAAAGLAHHYILKDDVMGRMFPRLRRH